VSSDRNQTPRTKQTYYINIWGSKHCHCYHRGHSYCTGG